MSREPDRLRLYAETDARGLARRLVLGVSSQFLTVGSAVLRNLLVVPFFLTAHGVDGYADWVKLMAVATLLQVFTLGQNIFYGYRIRTCRAARDETGLNRALADANAYFLRFYLVMTAGLAGSFSVLDVTGLVNLAAMDRVEASLVLALLAASQTGQRYRDMLRAVYIAHGELARSEVIQAAANALLGLAMIAALLLGGSILVLACLNVLLIPGFVATTALLDFRRYADVVVGISWAWPRPDRARLRSLVAHTIPDGAMRVLVNGPTVLLGLFGIASELVVQFHLTRTALTFLQASRVAIVFAVEMVRQRTQGDDHGFRRLHRRGALALGVYGGGLLGAMLGAWDLFLPLWTNGTVRADLVLTALMAVDFALLAFGEHALSLLRYGGRIGDVARCQGAAALFFLAVGIPALAWGGIYPMLATLLAGGLLFQYLLPAWYVDRRMAGSAVVGILWPLAAGLVAAAAAYGALAGLRAVVDLRGLLSL